MLPERLFAGLVVLALACLAALAIGRGWMLSRRGVRIFPIDRERSLVQGLADLGFALCFLLWLYETLAFSLPLDFHLVPAVGRFTLVDSSAARVVGVAFLVAGLVVYALALRAFGCSWRLGIDREHAGPLVTGGIFARCRNPVYLGLTLLAAGTFLVLGRLVLLLATLAFAAYFQHLVRREERFLAEHYGAAYRAYAARVGRWWTWRRGRA